MTNPGVRHDPCGENTICSDIPCVRGRFAPCSPYTCACNDGYVPDTSGPMAGNSLQCVPEPCSMITQIVTIDGPGQWFCTNKTKPRGTIVLCKVKCDKRKIKPKPNKSKCKTWGKTTGTWNTNSKKTNVANCNP